MAFIYFFGQTPAQEDLAKDIVMTLWKVYPGFDWDVRVYDGGVHIKLPLLGNGNWGMNKKFSKIDHDSAVFKRSLIMAAGELLERANIARKRADEDQPETPIEGVPEKDLPRAFKPKVTFDGMVVEDIASGVRDTPMPQVTHSQGNRTIQ